MSKIKLAIVGIQGLPNNYGGFETLSENLVKFLANKIDITVYCSSVDLPTNAPTYNNAKLKYVAFSSHGAKGIIYDSIALLDAVRNNFDVILILGFGTGLIIPFLSKKYRKKIILNFGGLDWKRNKWGRLAQKTIRLCEKLLVCNSSLVVADNTKIQEYITKTYHKETVLIAYGGDHVKKLPYTIEHLKQYPFLKDKYAFIVLRIQSDNNIEMMLKAFVQTDKYPFVVIGNWKASEYGQKIKKAYQSYKSLILLDAIYDHEILDILRSNCYFYVHGHSAGGTNPSLCEAMYLGLPVFAYASGYNEETTHYQSLYFKNEYDLRKLINNIDDYRLQDIGKKLKVIAEKYYRWNIIAQQYNEQFNNSINKIINKKL
jgi:glycosyltransferase involved in cell wall biosynthesis